MTNQHMWEPEFEAMPRAELRMLQLDRLHLQVAYAAANAPLYRRKLTEAGIAADAIRSLDDLRRLPFTTKSELRQSQDSHSPYGEQLAVPVDDIAWTYTTSGSTGTPLLIPRNSGDWDLMVNLCARTFYGCGMRRRDVVQMAYQYHFIMGGLNGSLATKAIGAQLINSGPGQTERQLWALERLGTSILLATASYAEYLARRGRERGLDLNGLKLHTVIGGGEAGFSLPSIKARVKEAFPTVQRALDIWGFTDMWSPLGNEFVEGEGLVLAEDYAIFEVIDSESGDVLPIGEEGELVVTDLLGQTTPLLRFRTGDRVRLSDEPGSCGRTSRRIPEGILGRVDDMITIRSRNLWPSAVAGVINEVPELNGSFLCIVDKPLDQDILTVRCELAVGSVPSPELVEKVRALILKVGSTRADHIDLVSAGTLPAFPYKAIRKLDKRRGETMERLEELSRLQSQAAR